MKSREKGICAKIRSNMGRQKFYKSFWNKPLPNFPQSICSLTRALDNFVLPSGRPINIKGNKVIVTIGINKKYSIVLYQNKSRLKLDHFIAL